MGSVIILAYFLFILIFSGGIATIVKKFLFKTGKYDSLQTMYGEKMDKLLVAVYGLFLVPSFVILNFVESYKSNKTVYFIDILILIIGLLLIISLLYFIIKTVKNRESTYLNKY